MSLSSLPRRLAVLGALFVGVTALAGCSFTPALSDTNTSAMALNFAAPNTPLEQIVYQDLGTRFGLSDAPDAPHVSVTVTTFSRDLGQSQSTDPAQGKLMTATGVLRITKGGETVVTTTRQATATYSANSQVIADNSAETAAGEQAAHALANTLELTIVSALTPQTAAQ